MNDSRKPKRIPGTNMWTSPPVYDDGRYSLTNNYDPESWSGCFYDLVRIGGMVALMWGLAVAGLWFLFGLAGSN